MVHVQVYVSIIQVQLKNSLLFLFEKFFWLTNLAINININLLVTHEERIIIDH